MAESLLTGLVLSNTVSGICKLKPRNLLLWRKKELFFPALAASNSVTAIISCCYRVTVTVHCLCQGGYVSTHVSVCLSVFYQNYSKTTDWMFMKCYGIFGVWTATIVLGFEWPWPTFKVNRGHKSKIVFFANSSVKNATKIEMQIIQICKY